MNEKQKEITIFIIMIIIIFTLLLFGGFVYGTWNDEMNMNNTPNDFTELIYTKGEIYFMCFFCILFINILIWGFVGSIDYYNAEEDDEK